MFLLIILLVSVQLLILLVVSTGFAPLAGMKGLGTHSQGAEAPSYGPAVPQDSHTDLPKLQGPPLGVCVYLFEDGREHLSKNLAFCHQ